MKTLLSRMRGLFGRGRRDAELSLEIQDHIDQLADGYVRRGLSPDEARSAARRDFGGVAQVKEQYREQRGFPFVHALAQDARYALRGFRRSPGFVVAVVVSLAVGIGVNSVVFTVLNALMLTSLPVRHPDDLFILTPQAIGVPGGSVPGRFSYPAFERLQGATPVPRTLAAMSRVARMYRRADRERDLQLTRVQLVSGDYFSVLGIAPFRGRLLGPDDDQTTGAPPVAVMSHALWSSAFASDPDVVGRTLTINGDAMTIAGVAPPGFTGVWLETGVDLWIPLVMQNDVRYRQNYSASNAEALKSWIPQEGIRWLDVIGRQPPAERAGTAAALTAEFQRLMLRQADEFSDPAVKARVVKQHLALEPFGQGMSNLRSTFAPPLYALFGMAALVLLIACGNAANLLLARAASRRREIAVKLSMGASRGRIIQQLLTESALLAALACACGLLMAGWAAGLLVHNALGRAASLSVGLNGRVIAFGILATLLTVVLAGLAPAMRTTNVTLGAVLRAASRGSAQSRLQKVLVAAQVALSLVLVVVAALFVQTLQNYAHIDVGYSQEHVLSVALNLVASGYPHDRMNALSEALMARVDAIPGVTSASTAMCGLAAGCRSTSDIDIEGYQRAPGEAVQVQENHVSRHYFTTTGMRLIEGRDFTTADRDDTAKVAIVNRATARRFFHDRSPLGRHIGYGGHADIEIVGVVEDARVNRVQQPPVPMAFYPMAQGADPEVVDVRTAGDPRTIANDVRRAVSAVAPDVPIVGVTILSDQVASGLSQERLVAALTSIFGLLALGLASLGVFGVVSYGVTQRTTEFGIRMALGAPRVRVLTAVLTESLVVVLVGLAAGVPAVLMASRLLTALLFGVSVADPSILSAAIAGVVAVAVVASAVPAWRASRVDPVVALRQE